jgi:hypothetical protein
MLIGDLAPGSLQLAQPKVSSTAFSETKFLATGKTPIPVTFVLAYHKPLVDRSTTFNATHIQIFADAP